MKEIILSCFLLLTLNLIAKGQGFIYRPLNPAFGGNTFNYQWLLSSAQAQDTFKDPNAKSSQSQHGLSGLSSRSPIEEFSEGLQRQLLNRITRDLIDDQFGEEGLKEGTYKFGEFQVIINNGSEGIVIRISDGKGGESTITVPYF